MAKRKAAVVPAREEARLRLARAVGRLGRLVGMEATAPVPDEMLRGELNLVAQEMESFLAERAREAESPGSE